MDAFLTAEGWLALVTLTFLEIVLGVDNVIFISILSGKLPPSTQQRARRAGLLAAMVMRILLLFSIAWIVRLTAPLFNVLGRGRLFLLGKATFEIHERLEGEESHESARVAPSFGAVILQIMLLDIVFSLDSVITAVGMADDLAIMVTAVIVSVGVSLIGDGLGVHVPKGYIYFAMGFSVFVEMINLRVRRRGAPVKLHTPY